MTVVSVKICEHRVDYREREKKRENIHRFLSLLQTGGAEVRDSETESKEKIAN